MSDDQKIEDYPKLAEEYLAGWKRAMADYQNREKEIAREREDMVLFANRAMILDLLPILDNLKTAAAHLPPETMSVGDGVRHVVRQFEDLLRAHGVSPIETVGHAFDPARHEAAGEESADDKPSGTIISEVQSGWMVGERVLRPARVVIAQ